LPIQQPLKEIKPSIFTEHFVSTQPGEPYRLLPFGRIGRPGLDKDITPEFAKLFKLPHFKPPIKLGSHEEETPAGGHIIRLEVRDDGLYAVPELNESGTNSLGKGEYRYHSPEIIWEDEGIFDAQGNFIQGPLILGDAFLHTPHLGEAAALYGTQVYHIENSDLAKEAPLSEEKNMDLTLFEKVFGSRISHLEAEKETLTEQVTELTAAKADLETKVEEIAAERDKAISKLEAIEADKAKAEKEAAVRESLGEVEFDEETVTMLSGLEDEQRDKLIVKFKALHEQAKQGDIEQELGSEGGGIKDPAQAFNLAVTAKMKDAKVGFTDALEMVKAESPDLYTAYNDHLKGGK
jgi:hypothetical protein